MNTFDIVTIAVVAFCLIRGAFRGLIGEVSGIIGVTAGFYGAYTYYPMASAYGKQWIDGGTILDLASFFVLFCAIVFVVGLLSWLIQKLLKLVFLGWVDRTFGLVFGALKGILIMAVLFVMMTSFLPTSSGLVKNSQLAPYLVQVSKTMTVFINKNTKSDFLKKLEGMF